MLIDPFTIIAQIVNFAILMVALKYFLYDRVIGAMDEREASIATRLQEADEREAAAELAADEYHDRRRALDDQRGELLDQARSDADLHRHELLDGARAEVDEERRRWERALQAEKHEVEHELQHRTAREVVALARRALSDLAGTELDEVALTRALDRLQADEQARTALFAEEAGATPVTVLTARPVPHDDRTEVVARLRSMGLEPQRRVRFDHDPDLILGAELRSGGSAVSWHGDDYLDQLGASVQELIDRSGPSGDAR